MLPRLRLRRALGRAIRRGHPWVWRDAIDGKVPAPGTEVAIADGRGRIIARGWADAGPIGVRLWTTEDVAIDGALIGARLDAAIALRKRIVPQKTDAFRLVHGEGDRMPGVVCDVYGAYAVLALDGEGAAMHREDLVAQLWPRLRELGVTGLLAKTGARGDRKVEVLHGEAPPDVVHVHEHGMVLCADLRRGQKTGLFVDQRTSRAMVRRLAKGRRVLDLYAYVGGFSAAAGRGGAKRVTTVDVAAPAIELARRTWAANDLPADRQHAIAADVPELLTRMHADGERFDLVIADPPSFAPSAATRDKALRAYEALHHACLRLLDRGGILLAASCSSHVDRPAFDDALSRAADRAGTVLQVIDRWAAPPDHPRLLAFPEGDYLKVTLARVLA